MTLSRSRAGTLDLPGYLAGQPLRTDGTLEVFNPYSGELVGTVATAGREHLDRACEEALAWKGSLTRYQRHEILLNTRSALQQRAEEFALLVTRESGLCLRDTTYEVGRALDVLQCAAVEALKDEGQVFSGDVSTHGKARKIFTLREPVPLVGAIAPFNHPLNQVVHKVAPAVAVGAPLILKPSEKTPLAAIRFAELLYQAGLPGPMLSVLLGSVEEFAEPLVRHDRIEAVSFTGSGAVGRRLAAIAGYKKLCLELGGNSPLLILEDADLELAAGLAAEGCYRNSGQRCTAVKRLLVHEKVVEPFTRLFLDKTGEYTAGDPAQWETRVGTVIDETAAAGLERRVEEAVAAGARILRGGRRKGALLEPTVVADVPRTCEMVVKESFGPLAPILAIRDLEDGIALANATAYGLSAGVVTRNIQAAIEAVKGIRTGTVNINQVPGYRIESTPFGGVKDSGLGIKEGVIEAMRFMSTVKTFSLPW